MTLLVLISCYKYGNRRFFVSLTFFLLCFFLNVPTFSFSGTKEAAHRLKIIFGLAGLKAAELHGNLTQVQRLDVSIISLYSNGSTCHCFFLRRILKLLLNAFFLSFRKFLPVILRQPEASTLWCL